MSQEQATFEEMFHFLEELKRQWVATIDAMVDPLMIVRPDFTITKANRALAELAQREIKGVLGEKCHRIFADRETPCQGCQMAKAAQTGKPRTFTLRDVRPCSYFEVTSQPVYSPTGQLEGVVQVYRDRTEARALQEQLQQSEKLASIGLLAGGIAHEINNPLGGILIFSQMLLREMPADSPHYPDVVEIEAATQRCKAIVQRLLDFARSQPSDIRPREQSLIDVTEAARSALRFAKVHENAKKVDIIEDWQLLNEPILGDRNNIIQLFLNLMQNAFQAMPDGGTLHLRSYAETRGKKRYGIWTVADTGIGIDKKHLPRIFDPFFTTKDRGEGTGLGLSICYGICKELGGLLEVESSLNVGTTFRIVLPLVDPTASANE